ncbi:MAG: bifunctional glutamate N-acetyltransferase/amino-acid acetyltransferase ArgJ [Hyphomicrobiaceae bacterium]
MAHDTTLSPFAPASLPTMPNITGVRFAAIEAGLKYKGRKDLMLAVLDDGTVAGGVLTTSKTCSAAVLWCRERLTRGSARALVVNAGNANAFTGKRGDEAVRMTAEAAANAVACGVEDVYLASTGVIGEPMDAGGFAHRITGMAEDAATDQWEDAARAIMTTDTFPKLSSTSVTIDGAPVTIAGFAKGSGMIAPDLATMLSFVFTDANIDQAVLQELTAAVAERTFNCTTVDGDTSTSDTVLVFATRQSSTPAITSTSSAAAAEFEKALEVVMLDLAQQVVKDGEGLTKFVTITVTGAENNAAAKRIALSMGNSPLLKTAIAGEDANWGRVVMAVGKAGEAADRDRLRIQFGPYELAREGERAPGYVEETVSAYMKNAEIEIAVDVGVGNGQATVWTCDLTHGYISINADYRS